MSKGEDNKFLEILIMKRLYEKVGQVFEFNQEQKELIFTEYVAAVKKFSGKEKTRGVSMQRNESQSLDAPSDPWS